MSLAPRTRRQLFGAAGLALPALAAASGVQAAPAMTAQEQANLDLVNAFCAAWPAHDLPRIMAFFSANPSYRQTEAQAPTVGREAVTAKIAAFLGGVQRFEVHDSWARGPMVVNERTDVFAGGRLKSWRGVGVFLVQDGKIVEWSDYTIARQLA